MTHSRPLTSGSKKLVAVATAAIPLVMLSSLALANPAAAAPAPAKAGQLYQSKHGALDSLSVRAAIQARTARNSIAAAVVASSLPRSVLATAGAITHTVVAGETVSAIAARFGVSTESVLSANNLTASTLIHPGKVLQISGSATAQEAAQEAPSSESNYTVRAGDTLGGIAAQHNISLATIFSLNGLSGSSVIHPGQSVKV
ncbi:LysM peptidoglycan-binding domain-containing protein, partial [Arthrobacter sp.]|uniref:LysM peptidoglycan-binding domain-containing protein n=1 Tax=Arthrobacter sp. TaxID=1667 RepID=UPI0026DFAB5C